MREDRWGIRLPLINTSSLVLNVGAIFIIHSSMIEVRSKAKDILQEFGGILM